MTGRFKFWWPFKTVDEVRFEEAAGGEEDIPVAAAGTEAGVGEAEGAPLGKLWRGCSILIGVD